MEAPGSVITFQTVSTAIRSGSTLDLALATAADSENPTCYFDGYLNQPEQSAAALLLVAKVARSRFWIPPNMLAAILAAADPVVTASTDRLRFESFSACCGVATRYDILPGGLDGPPARHGTTNVDLNQPVRAALADVHGLDPLHLKIGTDVTFTTHSARLVERKVPLPERWVRGFAEAQAATAHLGPRAVLSVAAARRFIRSLPVQSNGKSMLYAAPSRDGLRLSSTSTVAGAVPLGGPSRLRIIEPMLTYATSVTVYGPDDLSNPQSSGVSAWQADLPSGRFTLTLSPAAMRGFSGEGGLLNDLADPQAELDAITVAEHITDHPVIDLTRLAQRAGLTPQRTRRALNQLAAAGRVGYDAADQTYFHRQLPWHQQAVYHQHPRLAQARELVANGSVQVLPDGADVHSNGTRHLVRTTPTGTTCSCPWFAQHRDTRGPCKHLLAYRLAEEIP